MKILLILFFGLMFVPAFGQESISDAQTPLDQTKDNLQGLEQRVLELENQLNLQNGFSTEAILTLVSVIVVSMTFLIGYIQKRHSDLLQRTLEFLRMIDEDNGLIHKDSLQFGIWINEGKTFQFHETDPAQKTTIFRMLDWYDLLSYSCLHGALDKEMVIIILGGRMRSAYYMLDDFIRDNRENLRNDEKKYTRDELYKPFETFVLEHVKDRPV